MKSNKKLLACIIWSVFLQGLFSLNLLKAAPVRNAYTFTCLHPFDNSCISVWRGGEGKDKSLPSPIHLKWEVKPADYKDMTFDIYMSKGKNLRNTTPVYKDVRETAVSIINLEIGVTYFWQVVAKKKGTVVSSPVWRFCTSSTPPRWIEIDGVTNVRDMGGWVTEEGYVIKQGLLYRGGGMNWKDQTFITPKGMDTFINTLKIKTDMDLRHSDSGHVFAPEKVKWINVGIVEYQGIVSSEETGKEGYRKVFQELAKKENYPLYFHCQAGADRGGTVAFLVGGLLKVPIEDLLRDYDLTSFSGMERNHASGAFQGFLNALDAYGEEDDPLQLKIYNYLIDIGVTRKEIESIYSILTGRKFELRQPERKEFKTVMLLPKGSGNWLYTGAYPASLPPNNNGKKWYEEGYATAGWEKGGCPAGYGDEDKANYFTRLANKNGSYFFRREFEVQSLENMHSFILKVASDNAAVVYINGTLVDKDPALERISFGHDFAYWNRRVHIKSPALKKGVNLIAVYVYNNPGSSDIYLDMELEAQYLKESSGKKAQRR